MIELHIRHHLATVVMNAPPVNAINHLWLEGMDQALDGIELNPEISVVHFKSALKTFCAGADLGLMRTLLGSCAGRDGMVEMIRNIQRVLFRIEVLGAVTLAEIGGAALGGGLELALACDLRVVADTARLGLPEAGLGLIPAAGGTQRLPRIIGEANARRMILGAEVIDGEEAGRIGLAQWNRPIDELASFTEGLVNHISALPVEALKAGKRCLGSPGSGAGNGYQLELQETRKLHDLPATQQLLSAFLGGRK